MQALVSREQKMSSFHILCGVDVSYETLPVNPALCFHFRCLSLFFIRDNVTPQYLIPADSHYLALHHQRQTCDSLHSAAYQTIPSIFP